MSAYVLSPDALQDLQDIWDFVAFDMQMPPTIWKMNSSTHLRSWPGALGWGTLARI
jgi:hypothetical protein